MAVDQTQVQQWQLEVGSAETYERYMVPGFFAPAAEALVELVAPEPGERVLDVACGTGVVARQAAPRVGAAGRVVGLDLNEGMLHVARSVAADIRPPIEWRRADAADMPLADAEFDVALCQQALQFMPDAATVLAEMHRVLAPGGRMALSVCRSIEFAPAYVALAGVLRRHLGPGIGEGMEAIFPAWDTAGLRALLAAAGFRDVHVRIEIVPMRYPSAEDFLWVETASSPLAAAIEGLDGGVREALLRDLGAALAGRTDDDGIVGPLEVHVVTARG